MPAPFFAYEPFGNYFPLYSSRGKNIIIIGEGIGMAPLRPVIIAILDHRDEYDDLIINGARTPQDLAFAPSLKVGRLPRNSA